MQIAVMDYSTTSVDVFEVNEEEAKNVENNIEGYLSDRGYMLSDIYYMVGDSINVSVSKKQLELKL